MDLLTPATARVHSLGAVSESKMSNKENSMSTIIMRLRLTEPKVRKRAVRAVQKHRDKTKYTRTRKHKATDFGGLVFMWRLAGRQTRP